MEELIKYLSEKLDVDVSEISPTSHLIDDLDSVIRVIRQHTLILMAILKKDTVVGI